MNLAEQQILLLGGSSGIGLGIAQAVLERGGVPTLVGRSAERLSRAVEAIGGTDRVRTIVADITREDDVKAIFASHPPFHHVAVTAVTPYYEGIRQLDLAAARALIDSKLVAALSIAKHARFAPGGSLLLTSGIASVRPGPRGSVVCAVNGAIDALVRALALELAPVRVNSVSPGWVDTPIWDALAGGAKADTFANHARKLPVGRVGDVRDLAHAAVYLMENGFTTGEVLHVEGGHRLV